ncbi:MAG: IS66 family transposase [Gammaproteobacteria bacterium]|nr:IS66 family transposase [Gammaproteobacteria bacterium]
MKRQQADNEELRAQVERLGDSNRRLEHLVSELRRLMYRRKSEKLDVDDRQMSLAFEDLEGAISETQEAVGSNAPASPPSRKRRAPRRNLGQLPKHLPRIETVIEPDSIECPCGCGEMVRIGEDRSERLDIVPAKLRVLVTVRPKYACRACQQGVVQAAAPAHLVEGGLPTEGTLAQVLVSKYADHLPLYRQSQIYARAGVDLDRSTLAGWVGKASFHLAPVVDRLAWHLKRSGHLFMDETRAPVLDPGRGETKTGYLWGLARDQRPWGGPEPPGVVFFYATGRGGCHAEGFLEGFKGKLHVDGYAGYNVVAVPGRGVILCYCWAHARRKLCEIHDSHRSPVAAEGLRRIAQMYAIEKEIRGKPAEFRLEVRQARTEPLVEDFGIWLRRERGRVSPKSRLGEKLAYIGNHWDGLLVFLTDGRVEMDNNVIENRIRPLALNRKNALFAGHDEGAKSWARIASLVETAKMNDVDPHAYLKATLEAIASGHPASDMDALMPWAFTPASS